MSLGETPHPIPVIIREVNNGFIVRKLCAVVSIDHCHISIIKINQTTDLWTVLQSCYVDVDGFSKKDEICNWKLHVVDVFLDVHLRRNQNKRCESVFRQFDKYPQKKAELIENLPNSDRFLFSTLLYQIIFTVS